MPHGLLVVVINQIAMICSSMNRDCRMSVSSATDFPIRPGSQAAQVSGIYAFAGGYTYDVGAID